MALRPHWQGTGQNNDSIKGSTKPTLSIKQRPWKKKRKKKTICGWSPWGKGYRIVFVCCPHRVCLGLCSDHVISNRLLSKTNPVQLPPPPKKKNHCYIYSTKKAEFAWENAHFDEINWKTFSNFAGITVVDKKLHEREVWQYIIYFQRIVYNTSCTRVSITINKSGVYKS